MPLLFVVCVNGAKDFWEDYQRKKEDKKENENKSLVLSKDKNTFEEVEWQCIQLGSIIKVKKDEYFPCDMILISSSNKQTGICYVESKNLDGESNLKFKLSNKTLLNDFSCEDQLVGLCGSIKTNLPNHMIYNFNAILDISFCESSFEKKSLFTNDLPIRGNGLGSNISFGAKVETPVFNKKASKISYDTFQLNPSNLNKSVISINLENRPSNESKNSVDSLESHVSKDSNDIKKSKDRNIYLNNESCLLRGCSLKQTEYIIGVAIYLGHNTKIMKNFPTPSNKYSRIEKKLQRIILIILGCQVILSCIGSIISIILSNNNIKFLHKIISVSSSESLLSRFIERLGTWILIFTNLVPISLLVTLDMVKFIQSKFIRWDIRLYDQDQKIPANVQTSTLNEELGQINYILSDKTGTLTKNCMKFKAMNIAGIAYGKYESDPYFSSSKNNQPNSIVFSENDLNKKKVSFMKNISDISKSTDTHTTNDRILNNKSYLSLNRADTVETCFSVDNVPAFNINEQKSCNDIVNNDYVDFSDNLFHQQFKNSSFINYNYIRDFLLNMATCHSIFTESKENPLYQASSPDELAFVSAAKYFDVQYLNTDIENNIFLKINNEEVIIKLLATLPYSSDRKRMCIVIHHKDKYILYTKGSDEQIIKNCMNQGYKDSKIKNSINQYAEFGLRTLVFASKELSLIEYDNFMKMYQSAKTNINSLEKEEQLEKSFNVIEQNMILLGCSAVEDKLQTDVVPTIHQILEAGIKFWVITGDKSETAKKISLSSGLIDNSTKLLEFKDENENVEDQIERFNQELLEYEHSTKLPITINQSLKTKSNENKSFLSTGSEKLLKNPSNINSEYIEYLEKSTVNKNIAITIGSESITRIMANDNLRYKVRFLYYLFLVFSSFNKSKICHMFKSNSKAKSRIS